VVSRLDDKYDKVEKGRLAVVTLLKNKIQAQLKLKLLLRKRYNTGRTLFSRVISTKSTKNLVEKREQTTHEATEFCHGIWGNSFEHNRNAR